MLVKDAEFSGSLLKYTCVEGPSVARRPLGEEDHVQGTTARLRGSRLEERRLAQAKAVTAPILTVSHCRHADDQLLGNFRTRVSANSY